MARGFVLGKNNLTKDTLLQLAVSGGIVALAATSPYFLHRIAKAYFKERTRKMARNRARKLRELEQRKLLSFRHMPNNEVRIELTRKGKTLVRQYDLEAMQLKRQKHWDGRWHLVMYDVPHHHKRARDAFRQKLRTMGLYQLQKSVWVTPFDCREELEFLCDVFGLDFDKYFYYLSTSSIPREQGLKKFFALS